MENNQNHNHIQSNGQNNVRSEKLRQTTPTSFQQSTTENSNLAPWMHEILNEYTTTRDPTLNKKNRNISMHQISTKNPHSADELPSWLEQVLNEYSTTTVKNEIVSMPIQLETFGGGNGDSHDPATNRYSM